MKTMSSEVLTCVGSLQSYLYSIIYLAAGIKAIRGWRPDFSAKSGSHHVYFGAKKGGLHFSLSMGLVS